MTRGQKAAIILVGLLIAVILCLVSGYAGYVRGRGDGYQSGVIAGAGSGYNLRDPTYDEVRQFLAQDRTDANKYVEGEYVCSDFAADVNTSAEAQGLRCALVEIKYPEGSGHAVVAFQTVDRGLVFIEPQYDEEVTIELGRSYAELNDYKKPSFDDTVIRYLVIW
jgi:hypothetical protein